MSEEIGKHKGAVETLLHEKKELSRLLQIVDSQLQKHLGALEDAGVDTDQFIQQVQQEGQKQQKQKQRKQKSQQKSQERSSQRQQRSRNSSTQKSEGTDKNGKEEEQDADELLEGEDDFSDRDFSPR